MLIVSLLSAKITLAAVSTWIAAHPIFSSIITFVILLMIDSKIPENKPEWKILSKFLKKVGNLMTEDIKQEQIQQNKKIEEIMQKIKEIDNNREKDSKVSLKNQITQMYHFYQSMGYILEKDKEIYNDLYERYTANHGNSFVHKDIDPFMNSLPRFVSHSDAEAFYAKHGNYNNGTENK